MFQVRVEIKAIIASPLGVPWVNHPVRRRRDGKQGLYAAVFGWLSCRTTGANWDKSRKIKTRELNAYQIADARRFGCCVDDFSSRLMLDYILWGSLLCMNLNRRKEMQLRQTDPNLSSFFEVSLTFISQPILCKRLVSMKQLHMPGQQNYLCFAWDFEFSKSLFAQEPRLPIHS
jgi:hypothetical protein